MTGTCCSGWIEQQFARAIEPGLSDEFAEGRARLLEQEMDVAFGDVMPARDHLGRQAHLRQVGEDIGAGIAAKRAASARDMCGIPRGADRERDEIVNVGCGAALELDDVEACPCSSRST